MKRLISILIWIMLILSACQPVAPTSKPSQTETLVPPTSTSVPNGATETSPTTESAGGSEVTIEKRVDEATGIEYEYECVGGVCSRSAGTMYMFDTPVDDHVKVEWRIEESVPGQGSFKEIRRDDWTLSDFDKDKTLPPVSGVVFPILLERYFPENTTLTLSDQQIQIQNDMRGLTENVVAQIPIITTTSKNREIMVPLGMDKGIKIDITTPERMTALGGEENITTNWVLDEETGKSYQIFIDVYGVDPDGNVLARLAFADSIADIPPMVFRTGLLTIPGNFLDHIDQREQGYTSSVRSIVYNSVLTQADGTTVDVEIEIAPPIQE